MNFFRHITFSLILAALLAACKATHPIQIKTSADSTKSGITFQQKKEYHFNGNQVSFSNHFAASRFNDIMQQNDSTFVLNVAPENSPVNPSPWYAFKVWSATSRNLYLTLNYLGATHRYQPKVQQKKQPWKDITDIKLSQNKKSATFKLGVSADTTLIAAQELISTADNHKWEDSLARFSFVKKQLIGKSLLGKPIYALKIGKDSKRLIVVLSRQHPPEVTGYMAMQQFIRTIIADTVLANDFRKHYQILLVSAINPDGIDEGNWRHSAAGVDLNRDWENFQQPETQAVRDYILKTAERQKAKVYFGIDFHSTYYDVFYTNEDQPSNKTNLPGFTKEWLNAFSTGIPGFKPNIKPSPNGGNVSKSWMGRVLHAEALTYEVGDDTPRSLLRLKGKVAAEKMMEILLTHL